MTGVVVYLVSELVIRESDGKPVFLVVAHKGDISKPLLLHVIDPEVGDEDA